MDPYVALIETSEIDAQISAVQEALKSIVALNRKQVLPDFRTLSKVSWEELVEHGEQWVEENFVHRLAI